MSETITIWSTKYALTKGITTHQAQQVTDEMVRICDSSRFGHYYLSTNDWHLTEEAAVARAEKMRQKRLASLRKSIEKMEALRFTTEESENA